MRKTNLVLGFMVIMLLAMSTGLVAQIATPPASGDGSSGDPYQIATLDNLYWISQNSGEWDKHYIQTADIDASATSGWDGGAGFTPIGNSSINFTGLFDGDNHIITGLYINRSTTAYVGLFGYNSSGSEIKDICMEDVNITGNNCTGGLIGYIYGTISNSYSTGSVSGYDYVAGLVGGGAPGCNINNSYSTGNVTGERFIGGLIGQSYGGTINNSYASSIISGTHYVGGLVGRNVMFGTIDFCYSTGSVSGTFNTGGLVGSPDNDSTISNSHSSSSVNGVDHAGGLLGGNYRTILTNCYSTGSVSGTSNVGGLDGGMWLSTVSGCFWDTETSGQPTSVTGVGKTTAEMKTQSTFTNAGWDFTNTWEMIDVNYPRLQDNPDPALPVNLSSFYALYIGGTPTLYWTTQTETDNAYWNVYRGTCNNFEEAALINANNPVAGNGTTNSASDYVYIDNAPVVQNTTYWYWIEDVSTDGETVVHEPITLEIPFEDTPITPDTYGLHQNYPNPFNPSTSISFALEEDSDVELIIYNVKGAKIRTIFTDHVYANDITSVVWDGNDADGKQVSSGVYFYKLITDTKEYQRKMLLVK